MSPTEYNPTQYPHTGITGLIIAKNEEICIGDAVRSLQWTDEIIVVDCGSTDLTPKIACDAGARVVYYHFDAWDVSAARNFALYKTDICTTWALFLDADELSTPSMANAILDAIISVPEHVGAFQLAGKYIFLNRWMKHSMGYPAWHDRLLRLHAGEFRGSPHEKFYCKEDFTKERVNEPYIHNAMIHGINHWFRKHIVYASEIADEVFSRLESGDSLRQLLSPNEKRKAIAARVVIHKLHLGYLAPLLIFASMLVRRQGFRDGSQGILLSFMYLIFEAIVTTKIHEAQLSHTRTPSERS